MNEPIVYRGYLIRHTKTEIKFPEETMVTLETVVSRSPRFDKVQSTYDFVESTLTVTHKSFEEALQQMKESLDAMPEIK